ncbi:MAG: hypothetical protein OXF24_04215 [Hyphomicrobiales bacterium]|nr:hypothetical protein [Hyphomicrobiales bacterium]
MAAADEVVALLKKAGDKGLFVQKMERDLSMAEKQVRNAIDRAREKYRFPIYNAGRNKFAYQPKRGPWETKHG